MRQIILILTCAFSLNSQTFAQDRTFTSEGQKVSIETIVEREGVFWSMDFLPDGRILYTERSGALWIFDPKAKGAERFKTVTGVPKVRASGQGGLLEVRVHPDFATNKFVYLSYSEPVGDDDATTAIGRGKLEGTQLAGFQKFLSGHEPSDEGIHFGSRIEFDREGHIFFTIGDRNERHNAQKLGYHTGKVLRLTEDGQVPKDNPFVNQKDAKPEIWSYGHRNPQGLAFDVKTGDLWEAEMGPRGGDEINLVKKGSNYGWPVITYGREYWGPRIGEGTAKAGMEQPIVHWVPSISPSGLAIYRGSQFAKWDGNLFLACLSGMEVRRVMIEGGKVVKQETLLKNLNERFRAVRNGPDGALYFTTDNGKIIRLSAVK